MPLQIPVPSEGENDVNENDYAMLKMHALNGAQRQAEADPLTWPDASGNRNNSVLPSWAAASARRSRCLW